MEEEEKPTKQLDSYDVGMPYVEFDYKSKGEIWYCELLFNNHVVGTLKGISKKEVEKLSKRWLKVK